MAKRIETRDAQQALGGLVRREVKDASPNNDVVSKTEAEKLGPLTRRAADELRATKGKGARVRTEEVVDRAMQIAMGVWKQFNPPGGPDGRYLSKREVDAIDKADAAVGAMTRAAYLAVKNGEDANLAVRKFVESNAGVGALFRKGSSFGAVIDARPGQPARAEVPKHVLEAFDVYYQAEAADWASATLKAVHFGGRDLYAVHLGTDGDDGYLELFEADGTPLASGRLWADDFARWDAFFGLGRFTGTLGTYGATLTEGLSEDDERAAAGQITSAWAPELVIASGGVSHDASSIWDLQTPTSLTPAQREVAIAALDLMFDRSFRFQLPHADAASFLGQQGQLRIGTHGDHIVADWRDIDDASRTFYFTRQPSGALRLAIDQFNN